MPGRLADWLDHRTGCRKLMDAVLLEHIPGGAKWRYVWGSTLVFVFLIQLITGVLLMTAYSPGDSTAWGSVYFIQYEMDFGWLIRGLHHFGSQTMVILLGLHMLQVVIAGAQLPPREINWWLGLALMGIVLGLSLTGYLLPWDQKGFFATQVATNILGSLPGLGSFLQKVVVGGPVYGNHTLTHFYSLHVGILPPLLIVLMVAHVMIFRRHGITAPKNAQGEAVFWPEQAFRDMVACLVVFGLMLGLVIFSGHGNKIETPPPPAAEEPGFYERLAKAGRDGLGANLDAPADPLTEGYPARPEWYFLFLFQLLKYFEGEHFLIGAVVIPNAVGLLLFILPLLGYGRMRPFGHLFGILVVVALLASVAVLTALALADDSPTPYPFGLGGGTEKAEDLHHKFEEAAKEASRAVQLASLGIPEEGGARYLLRGDPLTRGPKLFEKHCGVCHAYSGDAATTSFAKSSSVHKASDLAGFASESWIRGLLENPGAKKYFGNTKLEGMQEWRNGVNQARETWKEENADTAPAKIKEQDQRFDTIAKWLAEQSKPKQARNADLAVRGKGLFTETCSRCHTFQGEGKKKAPDLTDYGSDHWIRGMIMDPAHPSRHGKNNEMPAFRTSDGPDAELRSKEFLELQEKNGGKANVMELSDVDREVIIRWLTRDYRAVFGGKAVSGPPK